MEACGGDAETVLQKQEGAVMVTIGIVVLNYQDWELSLRCMESIRGACGTFAWRIYLIDNASKRVMPPSVRNFLKKERARACFFTADKNRGYASGNNLGIACALKDGCGVIVIANSDIVFQSRAIEAMAVCLMHHPEAGIVGPMVVGTDGSIQQSCCSMRTGIQEIFQVYTAAKKIYKNKCSAYHCQNRNPYRRAYVYHVSGCCFAFSAACAKDLTPLDEGTMLYGEELMIGLRMEQLGYRTIYEPRSVVVHEHGATTSRMLPLMYQCISQSELYYCGKYLKAAVWQLWVLYQYRRWLYRLRCLRNRKLARYRTTFLAETKKSYRQALTFAKQK